MYTLFLSFGSTTRVWVCEPRQVCTAATCLGLRISEMSKMRTRRRLRGKTFRATIEAGIGHFDRHEHQVFVDRNVALPAGTDHRRKQGGFRRITDIENIYTVKIALEKVVSLEGKIGVGEGELRDHELHWFWDFGNVADAQ